MVGHSAVRLRPNPGDHRHNNYTIRITNTRMGANSIPAMKVGEQRETQRAAQGPTLS